MWDDIEGIYRAYHAELLRYCGALCRDAALAEDLSQEVFLRMLNSGIWEDLGPNQRRAWLYTTARRLFVDKMRRRKLEQSKISPPSGEAAIKEAAYTDVEVKQLLRLLPPKERTLVRMRYLEGYNATELGELYGEPPATIRSRLAKALKTLRQLMEET